MNTAMQVDHLEIHIRPIRKGWYRASASLNGSTYARAARTDISWISAAAHVWREVRGSMQGFDEWVAERVNASSDPVPGADDLDDCEIHSGGE